MCTNQFLPVWKNSFNSRKYFTTLVFLKELDINSDKKLVANFPGLSNEMKREIFMRFCLHFYLRPLLPPLLSVVLQACVVIPCNRDVREKKKSDRFFEVEVDKAIFLLLSFYFTLPALVLHPRNRDAFELPA